MTKLYRKQEHSSDMKYLENTLKTKSAPDEKKHQLIEYVLKNWDDRMGYYKASRGSHFNDVFHSQMERFNISNKTILLKKYP